MWEPSYKDHLCVLRDGPLFFEGGVGVIIFSSMKYVLIFILWTIFWLRNDKKSNTGPGQ